MTPAPVAAAAAVTVAEKGPTWSSELRSWLPTLIIGLILIGVLVVVIFYALSTAISWFSGNCEEQGYETVLQCAFAPRSTLNNLFGGLGGGFASAFLAYPFGGKDAAASELMRNRHTSRLAGRWASGYRFHGLRFWKW